MFDRFTICGLILIAILVITMIVLAFKAQGEGSLKREQCIAKGMTYIGGNHSPILCVDPETRQVFSFN